MQSASEMLSAPDLAGEMVAGRSLPAPLPGAAKAEVDRAQQLLLGNHELPEMDSQIRLFRLPPHMFADGEARYGDATFRWSHADAPLWLQAHVRMPHSRTLFCRKVVRADGAGGGARRLVA